MIRRPALVLVVIAVALSGCGSGGSADETVESPPLKGVGSKEALPVISQWEKSYRDASGSTVDYEPSGNGVDVSIPGSATSDFLALDAPLTPLQFEEGDGVTQMIPWLLGGVLIVYDTEGVPDGIKLTSRATLDIFLGRIDYWDDPAIELSNPGVSLPHTLLTPVYRADENGDNYVLSNYLTGETAESEEYLSLAGGAARSLRIPGGVPAKGMEGMEGTVRRKDGALGYLHLSRAQSAGLKIARIENPAGEFPEAGPRSIEVAARLGSSVGPNKETSIAELPKSARGAYPIAGYGYVVVPIEADHPAALKAFLRYALGEGQALVPRYGFVPLPPQMKRVGRSAIGEITG